MADRFALANYTVKVTLPTTMSKDKENVALFKEVNMIVLSFVDKLESYLQDVHSDLEIEVEP